MRYIALSMQRIEKGYFKEEGVKVNIKFPSNPDPLTLAAKREGNSWLVLSARCCYGESE